MFMTLLFAAAYLFPATDLLVKGVPFPTVALLVLYSLPSVVTQTFPMAMLLGALLAFGRLSLDKEIIAIYAAGISFPRTIRMVWIMGIVVSILAFLWNDFVVPPASRNYVELKQNSAKKLLPSDRWLLHSIEKRGGKGADELISIDGGYDANTQTLRRVTIVKYSNDPKRRGQIDVVIYCETARPKDNKGLQWKYYDGYFMVYAPDPKTGRLDDQITTYFKELETLPREATIPMTFEETLRVQSNDPNRFSFRELRATIVKERAKGIDTRGMEVDLYGKIALPLASLIFGLVGAALGQSTARGGGKAVGFGVAIFIAFLYWVSYQAMFVVGKNGGMPPMLASFMTDLVGVIAAVILVSRASR
jgi:lipopolysaccharide export system permease protein